jgi:uncharacterized damage-inducible protein DinB
MEPALHTQILEFAASKLEQMASRIETCLGKLDVDQVWARGHESENAVGNLVLHLCGNVRQWIVSGVGGRSDTRDRNAEFDARGGIPIEELIERLTTTVAEAAAVIRSVSLERLSERLVIQNYPVSVLEAILHVMEHFSGHTGQIIFATKMLTGTDLGFYRHLRTTAAHAEKLP